MHFCFKANEIDEKNYKWIFQYLCGIANFVYFTYENSLMPNENLFDLYEQCEQIQVSERIKNLAGYSILGFKNDIFVKLYIFRHENIFDLLESLGYRSVLFYIDQKEIAYVGMDDWQDIHLETDDKKLIERLSKINSDYRS